MSEMVWCLNCDSGPVYADYVAETDTDRCPKCKLTGALIWADDIDQFDNVGVKS